MPVHDNKQFIRKEITTQKKMLSEETIILLSHKICTRLIKTYLFQMADCIAIYYAMEDEVHTSGIIEEWYNRKRIALPVISGGNIHFCTYTGKENLAKNAFHIQEPTSTEVIPVEEIDLFIVPGVAFDRKGNRLGRGKGYYDKYMAGITKPMIGICFDFQLIDSIPAEEHDIKMNMIITENSIISEYSQANT